MSSRTDRANAVRALSMDAVQAANSGHPGAPMGLADVAEVLWREVLRHSPANPEWPNRDRFVLSNGHGSMLLYSVLHLSGYDLSLDEIRAFRQLGSRTAGHPEYGECPGVETTTGPLGQGIANAVGMAMAEKRLAEEFNQPGHDIVNHRTWVIVGDGCLMEGVSHEAASLAGTLRLGKLICIYDDNGISIDGETKGWYDEDVPARFESYGWRVIRGVDGHDGDEIAVALEEAGNSDGRPTLVCCRTIIGYGSPNKQGSADSHGAALGVGEVAAARAQLNWGYEPFQIPQQVYQDWDCREAGAARERDWSLAFEAYRGEHPHLAVEFERRMAGELPDGWQTGIRELARSAQDAMEPLETRKSSQRCIGVIADALPELFGGSADLTGSNGTRWSGAPDERYLSFGVREFGMSAITNGMLLHGGLRPFSGTFLVFMEYARNAVRLSALMRIPNIFVYTHDSVALGEDGPTHQPVEQLTNLRTTPNLRTWRPCDTVECAVAWEMSVARQDGPSTLVLTRQKTDPQARDVEVLEAIRRGGYVLSPERERLDAVIIAAGSEVMLAMQAQRRLKESGVDVRVISMPCAELFLEQDAAYREAVLPPAVRARVAVEAGQGDYWYRFVGLDGAVVSIDRFGVSAPGDVAMEALGMTTENVIDAVRRVI
ncbi:MAG: transketolase [Pseudomonadales bacterium]|jgi:transketolase|nr:transketolase [Pseudomonadales bacterium]MDP6469474.1 transketolase [Pseudomonadales bacterium]MDP6827316.1 transketolase [Pseudomonadales bacterium]MDP6971139.1 transketolase [Pseudomonadales bacterium]